MVFMILHKCYIAFGDVSFSHVPLEYGLVGELRISVGEYIQHKVYRPTGNFNYSAIHLYNIDITQCGRANDTVRIVTLDEYEYWLYFSSKEDAIIFHRMLCYRVHRLDYEGSDDSEDCDYWEEGAWTGDHRQDDEPEVNTNNNMCCCNYRHRSLYSDGFSTNNDNA